MIRKYEDIAVICNTKEIADLVCGLMKATVYDSCHAWSNERTVVIYIGPFTVGFYPVDDWYPPRITKVTSDYFIRNHVDYSQTLIKPNTENVDKTNTEDNIIGFINERINQLEKLHNDDFEFAQSREFAQHRFMLSKQTCIQFLSRIKLKSRPFIGLDHQGYLMCEFRENTGIFDMGQMFPLFSLLRCTFFEHRVDMCLF
jgi:hypothetical protein